MVSHFHMTARKATTRRPARKAAAKKAHAGASDVPESVAAPDDPTIAEPAASDGAAFAALGLQLFDGNGVQFLDAWMQIAILFQAKGSSRRLSLKMSVIHQHRGQIRDDFGQPARRRFGAEH